ncbi:hypothetical protein [Dyadobacter sp. Leaf189]|uniref:hypothetical protein n=1 Tax=Dyadobacter sp. Leaf189 TaxID=1736295 RepID=UPI0006F72B70|nr:hypothetical protein [Dyadobacter sp. Leaf189]KQS33162.1 hypothetical protein ASG33_03495 [Dyadobacter sp. Leaf189]
MNTNTHTTPPSDAMLLAYGEEVSELLSSSAVERWKEELWTMFGGYILALKDLGYAPNLSNTYFSFKQLLDFFENVERIRLGESSPD